MPPQGGNPKIVHELEITQNSLVDLSLLTGSGESHFLEAGVLRTSPGWTGAAQGVSGLDVVGARAAPFPRLRAQGACLMGDVGVRAPGEGSSMRPPVPAVRGVGLFPLDAGSFTAGKGLRAPTAAQFTAVGAPMAASVGARAAQCCGCRCGLTALPCRHRGGGGGRGERAGIVHRVSLHRQDLLRQGAPRGAGEPVRDVPLHSLTHHCMVDTFLSPCLSFFPTPHTYPGGGHDSVSPSLAGGQ